MNRQISSQNKASEGAKTLKLISKGVTKDRLTREDHQNLIELEQQVASRNKRYVSNILVFFTVCNILSVCLSSCLVAVLSNHMCLVSWL